MTRRNPYELPDKSRNRMPGIAANDHPLFVEDEVQYSQQQRLLRQVMIAFEGEPPPQGGTGGEGRPGNSNNSEVLPGLRRDQVPQSLLTRLTSSDPRVSQTRQDVAEIFSDLMSASPAEARSASNRAVRDLLYIGPDAAPFLAAGLNHPNFRVREASQRALGTYLGTPGGYDTARALIAASLDPCSSDEFRRRANTLLTGQLGLLRRLTPALFNIMDNPNTSTEVKQQLERFLLSGNVGNTEIADGNGRIRYVMDPASGRARFAVYYQGNHVQRVIRGGETIIERGDNGRYVVTRGGIRQNFGDVRNVEVAFPRNGVANVTLLDANNRALVELGVSIP